MAPALVLSAPATNTAFFVVFGLFAVAMVVLVAIIIVWAVRHDVAGNRAWRARQQAAMDAGQPVPQNRLQQRAWERAQQREQRAQAQQQQRQRQRPPRSAS